MSHGLPPRPLPPEEDLAAVVAAAELFVREADAQRLRDAGVAAVYTPKNFSLEVIMGDLLAMVEATAD